MHFLAGVAGVIDINGTVILELITFLIMLAVLARYVYPEIVRLAESRQRAITEQLKEAEQACSGRGYAQGGGGEAERCSKDGPERHRRREQIGGAATPGAQAEG